MNLRPSVVLLFAVLPSGACQAQLGLYAKYDAVHFTDNNAHSSTWYNGPGFGVYYNFLHLGPVALGGDLRGDYAVSNNLRYRSGLIGIRAAVKPPVLPIRPYIQGLIGVAGTGSTGPYAAEIQATSSGDHFSNKFAYQVVGGLDYAIVPHLDLRAVELGYGQVTGTTGAPDNPKSDVFSIGAGLVLRLF